LERCPGSDGHIDLRQQAGLLYNRWTPSISEDFRKFSELVEAADGVREDLARIGILNPRLLFHAWRRRLISAVQQEKLSERVVCGFSACVDTVCPIKAPPGHGGPIKDNWQVFLGWVAESTNKDVADTLQEAQDIGRSKAAGLQKIVSTREEMLAALLAAMETPGKEWKPRVDERLMDDVVRFFAGLQGQGRTFSWPGGGAGNMSWVLRNLGCATAGTWLYNFDELTRIAPYCLKYVCLEPSGGVQIVPASEEQEPRGVLSRRAPARLSFALEFAKEFGREEFRPYGINHVAQGQGRVIFVFPYPVSLSAQRRPWARIVFRKQEAGQLLDYELSDDGHIETYLGEKGWPFVPVFCSWTIDGDTLMIHLATNEQMGQIAGTCEYFLMGGIQGLCNDLFKCKTTVNGRDGPTALELLTRTLQAQLSVLHKARVTIHWEVGGIKSVEQMDLLIQAVRGVIHSASLNHTELHQLACHHGFSFAYRKFFSKLTRRYHQGEFLARLLGLRELYIHGNEADITLRQAASCGELRYELAQGLFTKALILAALMYRANPTWFESTCSCPSVVKPDGLLELVNFAFELAHDEFPEDQEHVFELLTRFGYLHRSGEGAYSVVTIPVVWPELMSAFSTVGAGDISSAVLAVFAGK